MITDENKTKVLSIIRFIAEDLSDVDDDDINVAIELFEPFVWEERFGSMYSQALAYFVAHKLKYKLLTAEQGSNSAYIVGGQITSEHEGDLSISYGGTSSGSNGFTDDLDKTIYGIEFKRLRQMFITTAITRFG